MNINTLDLNLLLVFDAILRTHSTTLAGEQMGLTQSAVSNALKRLRLAFDDPLFVKTQEGMMPTLRAEKMAETIQSALLQIRNVVEDRGEFDARHSERTFRLCMSDIGQMIMLPPLLNYLRTEAPHINLETIEATPQEAPGLLARGEVDLAIGFLKDLGDGIYNQRLKRETFVCLVRADHPTIRDHLALGQYLSAAHAEYRPSGGSHSIFEDAAKKLFAAHGVERRVALRLAHSTGIGLVITHSDFVIAVPSRLGDTFSAYPNLRVFPLPFESPVYNITQQWHGRCQKDPGHAWLRTTFALLFRE
ncbi:LysR family transcriptional regulator [Ferribacterium limneticum]|uniref:LysR family transcriptional regulator n=1 Tax=Ferribacterium limneticum TaxID=76259 RepID=UPI001CFB270D|nr:LysR family transcriptional regulator [Ferribacterium limneticum]UCV17848.1 LysR family transcriptional regulator [Ferribacterium limneticum]